MSKKDDQSESVELATLQVAAQKGPGVDVSLMGRGSKNPGHDQTPQPPPAPEAPAPAPPKLVEDNALAIVTNKITFGEVSVGIPTMRDVHIFSQTQGALQIGTPVLDTESKAMQRRRAASPQRLRCCRSRPPLRGRCSSTRTHRTRRPPDSSTRS